jgi:hypothetical protein
VDIRYNRAYFVNSPPIALDLLRVGWIVAPEDRPPPPDATEVARDGSGVPWILYRRTSTPAPAQLVDSWRIAADSGRAYPSPALSVVLDPAFDPSRLVVLEQQPGVFGPPPRGAGGTVAYQQRGDQASRIIVDTTGTAVLLVRTAFDPNWHATLDGRPVPLLRADYLLQGVAVPDGHHTVALSYDDPSIGYGLAGSAIAVVLLMAAGMFLRRRDRHVPAA